MSAVRVAACVLFAALIAGGAVIVLTVDSHALSPEEMTRWLREQGQWAPLAVIGLMILHCVIPFPAELLALCAGAVFGVVYGSFLIWTGAMIGATISFGLSRWLGRDALNRVLSPRHLQAVDRWNADQSAITLLICRFIPVLAFNLINYGAGLTRVSWRTFLWTTAIGILPITVLSVWLGAQMRYLDWTQLLILSAAGIVVVVVGHAIVRRYRRPGGQATPGEPD